LPFLGGKGASVLFGDDEMKQIFLSLELISVWANATGKIVRFNSNGLKGKLI